MASTFTPSLKLELQGTGENNGTWGAKLNDAVNRIDEAISGVYGKTLVNGVNNVSVANGVFDENRNAVLVLTGALTSAAEVVIPDIDRVQGFINRTTGSQVVTVRNSTGTGVVVPANYGLLIYCDGTSVRALTPGATADGVVNLGATVSASVGIFNSLNFVSALGADKVSCNAINASVANFTSKVSVHTLTAASISAIEVIATSVTCKVLDADGTVSASVLRATSEIAGNTISVSSGVFTSLLVGGVNPLLAVNVTSSFVYAMTSTNSFFTLGGGPTTGDLITQVTITPRSSTSRFMVEAIVHGQSRTTDTRFCVGVFSNVSTSAHAYSAAYGARGSVASYSIPAKFIISGWNSVGPVVVSLRAGADTGTGTYNGSPYGNPSAYPMYPSGLIVTEIN